MTQVTIMTMILNSTASLHTQFHQQKKEIRNTVICVICVTNALQPHVLHVASWRAVQKAVTNRNNTLEIGIADLTTNLFGDQRERVCYLGLDW
jgi:hypothetical protein